MMKVNSVETETVLEALAPASKPWIRRILFRPEDKGLLIISRSYVSVASTFLLVTASLLPYADVFLDLFIDTSAIRMNRFPTFSVAMWSYSMCISPLLILAASKFKPYRFAYIVPVYVYITMLCGFLFLDANVRIESDWVFRGITFVLSLILTVVGSMLISAYKGAKMKEEVMDEFIKIRQNG